MNQADAIVEERLVEPVVHGPEEPGWPAIGSPSVIAFNGISPRRSDARGRKVLVVGAAGSGKSTLVRAASASHHFEAAGPIDDSHDAPTTTVGFDFGRVGVDGRVVSVFGAPADPLPLWGWLTRGATAILLVERSPGARTLELAARLRSSGVPFAPVVNLRAGEPELTPAERRRVAAAACGFDPLGVDVSDPAGARSCIAAAVAAAGMPEPRPSKMRRHLLGR